MYSMISGQFLPYNARDYPPLSYLDMYLQYLGHENEFNNAVLLNVKEDALGNLQLGKAEIELLKVCKRNGLSAFLEFSLPNTFNPHSLDLIYGAFQKKHYIILFVINRNLFRK